MFHSLYARLMTLFMAVLCICMMLLSILLYVSIRDDKVEARLDELTKQARDIAYLASRRSVLPTNIDRYLEWKAEEVTRDFEADVLIVDRLRQIIPISGIKSGNEGERLSWEETLTYLLRVLNGEEIRVQTRPQNRPNDPVFTVGVPWVQNDVVVGAVFIHTSAQTIQASYQNVLWQVGGALALALGLMAVLTLLVTRRITHPLRQMSDAAEKIAHGDFDYRVTVGQQDEIGRLAIAFNSMAEDLKNIEEMRRGFVANVSHELRSPLTSMQGFLQGMRDGTIPEQERDHYLDIVVEETRRMRKLIMDLLDLSRIESGKIPLNRTRFDINEMIRRVLIRQEARIDEKHLEIDVTFRQDPCMVTADADRIEQVITNLIDNAIKYMQDGGRLTLWTHTVDAQAYITVSDNGPGIPQEDLPFIFERFYKVDKAHTAGNGTGLGLSIVKKILDQHDSKMTVTSTLGKGTSFVFSLSCV